MIQKTHYTAQVTFDFEQEGLAVSYGEAVNAHFKGRLELISRRGTKVTIQGSPDNLQLLIEPLRKARPALHTKLQDQLDRAEPAADAL